jgi:ABC-type Fe3+ transport system permease subunit
MISSGVIEKPGKWRGLLIMVICVIVFIPALPLLWTFITETAPTGQAIGIIKPLLQSFSVAIPAVLFSILLGIPAGIAAALYHFPGKRVLLALLTIPIIVPSFLLAIGLSQLRLHLGLSSDSFLSGWAGTVLVFTAPATSLVLFVTFLSARCLSKSQIEYVRLVGGELLLVRQVAKAVAATAVLAGILAGVLTLSDPGPGQIFGFPGVAYEILVSFSALYDFSLAAKQCLILTAVVLVIAIPVAVFIAPNIVASLLGKDIEPNPLLRNKRAGSVGFLIFSFVLLVTTILPLAGIIAPLFAQFPIVRPLQEVSRTLVDTFLYALIPGLIATLLGYLFAIAIGRQDRRKRNALIVMLLILSLPPALNALGIIKLGTLAPSWLDPLLRSRFTVEMALALRFFPIAAILAIKAFGSTPVSHVLAAATHGISLSLYLRRVLIPILLPSPVLSCVIVALLATAEVGTVLLLRPPGADSLPVQIFTIMANASTSLIAALCFFYIAGASVLLSVGLTLTHKSAVQ